MNLAAMPVLPASEYYQLFSVFFFKAERNDPSFLVLRLLYVQYISGSSSDFPPYDIYHCFIENKPQRMALYNYNLKKWGVLQDIVLFLFI
jgi:hypothetical protein